MEFGSQRQPGYRDTDEGTGASHSSEKLRTDSREQGWWDWFISPGVARPTTEHTVGTW